MNYLYYVLYLIKELLSNNHKIILKININLLYKKNIYEF
jgi:hypothetical protein